jgi:putative ABC transport system permease protein
MALSNLIDAYLLPMNVYLNLYRRFILRSLIQHRLRTIVTVIGIAFGVGVMLAIRLANQSSLESFRAATYSIAGDASLQITGSAGPFDEMLFSDSGWLRKYGQVSPVVEGVSAFVSPGGDGAPKIFLHVLGVDILRDSALRRYRLLSLGDGNTQPVSRDLLLLLADPTAIVLTERFAREHGLSSGSRITLAIGDSRKDFTIRGLLLDEGPAHALDGRFALMDIAAAQWAYGKLGLLDRFDIKLEPGVRPQTAETEIRSHLPEGLLVSPPGESYGQVEKMISAFHFNLSALGSIALIVGLYLIYNTVSTSVIGRREEIGMLRAVGVGRRVILLLFLGEASMFALLGGTIGLALGHWLAIGAVRATAMTVKTFYVSSAATAALASNRFEFSEVLFAVGIALPLSVMAGALPSLEASRVRPIEAIRGAERLGRSIRPPLLHLGASVVLFAIASVLALQEPVRGLPVFGYLSAVTAMLAGSFLVPGALWAACKVVPVLTPRRFTSLRLEARLASSSLGGSISRLAISISALAVSLAMMIAISIMIGSFRDTVAYWINQTLAADIYIKPDAGVPDAANGKIGAEAMAAIRSDPDIAAVDSFTSQSISYEGRPITLGAGDFGVLLDHGRLMFKSPADARQRMREAIGQDAVVISESLSLIFGRQPGDVIELPTPSGPHRFSVAAVYYDYSSNSGSAVMDRSTHERLFRSTGDANSFRVSPTSLSVFLLPGASSDAVVRRLEDKLADKYQLEFSTNQTLRAEAMRIFDGTFAITYSLEAIAITIAALGVISTLITLILERQRELSILRLIGAARSRVRRIVVVEAAIIGAVAQAIGVIVGIGLSFVLIYVINVQSFGWTIQYHFPAGFVAQATVFMLALTALVGLYPGQRASKVPALTVVREE